MIDIVNEVCDIIEDELDVVPVVGALPPVEGVAVQVSSGSVVAEYFPRTALNRTTLVVNSKSREQGVALQNLIDIHEVLTKRIGYPSTEDWQIVK